MTNAVPNKALDMLNIVTRHSDRCRGFRFDFYLIFVSLRLSFNELTIKTLADVILSILLKEKS